MSVAELNSKISNDSLFIILDVRTPQELVSSLGKIDGVINIPVQELEERISELEEYRDYEIGVICKIGVRFTSATILLIKNGFNAVNIIGGMIEYRANE
jgi:rhodanese-related sulfurtransferase